MISTQNITKIPHGDSNRPLVFWSSNSSLWLLEFLFVQSGSRLQAVPVSNSNCHAVVRVQMICVSEYANNLDNVMNPRCLQWFGEIAICVREEKSFSEVLP